MKIDSTSIGDEHVAKQLNDEVQKFAKQVVTERTDDVSAIQKVADLVAKGAAVPEQLTQEDFSKELSVLARKHQDRHPNLSDAQAHAAVLQTPEGRALYQAHSMVRKSMPQRVETIAPPDPIVKNDDDYQRYLSETGQNRQTY